MTTTHPTPTLRSGGTEWVDAVVAEGSALRELRNVLVEVSAYGTADAAGLSFGAFKDFLVPVQPGHGERRLQLEIDGDAGTWAFRADGVLVERVWWDAAVKSVEDLFAGTLTVKARWAKEVTFRDLSIRALESSPRVSVILTCYRFAQRLRVALTSWCRQRVPSGALEIIVLNPDSPDGTHELVASMAAAYPEVRLRELPVAEAMSRNKGWMLNRGMAAARGEWIWLTDADCVFPPDAAARLLETARSESLLLFGERRHLTRRETDALLAGRTDPAAEFERLVESTNGRGSDSFPWGYTQILHRSQAARVRYREDLDHFAGSDGTFLEECRSKGLQEVRLDGLTCLHLAHPFAWYGTKLYL
ncbi:MAG TPA: glycosyltransferase family 2 protein [Thermoanaerobaculia bacterium]|nr:glycosyltransferase family 2 protein [Thermoanaerobaculia bacterium]